VRPLLLAYLTAIACGQPTATPEPPSESLPAAEQPPVAEKPPDNEKPPPRIAGSQWAETCRQAMDPARSALGLERLANIEVEVKPTGWGEEWVLIQIPWPGGEEHESDLIQAVRYDKPKPDQPGRWTDFHETTTAGTFNLLSEKNLPKGRVRILLMSFAERDARAIDARFRPVLDRCLAALP
jgi:hypothetical protein